MAEVYAPIAKDESFKTSESTPRNVADVLAEELARIAGNILPPNASQIAYDNTESGLTATNVQDAIDEVISSQADVIADTMADLTENKTATITDGVADFETIDGSLVKSLVVEIEPSQSGSGTPSPDNIRPITGWTQEDVKVLGRNYCPNLCENVTRSGITVTKNSDGTYTFNGTATATIDFFINSADGASANADKLSFGRDGRYLYSGITGGSNTTYRLYVAIYKTDGTTTYGGINDGQGSFDLPSDEKASLFVRIYNGYTCDNLVIKPMIRLREYIEDTTFYPYHGKTYTTPFNQTVYGGTLDVLSGELTIDTAFITLNGTENCTKSAITTCDIYLYTITPADFNQPFITSAFEYSPTAVDAVGYTWRGSSNTQIRIGFAEYETSTVESFKAWLSQNPLQIAYKLATPTTLSLTPQKVKSLVGENHISASTGDVLECKFSMLINGDDLAQIIGG